ncbi:MAG: DMT family transporter [Candidatus Nanopelagicales bacterium]|nr:DMT family transporter [Candidatus Nanopelagicales bacterium]
MSDTKTNKHAGRSVGLSLLGNGLAGTAGTVAAIYAINTPSPVIGFVRLFIGAITLLMLAPFLGGKLSQLPRLITRPGVWIMGASSASYQVFFFASVDRTGVATAALITVGCIPVSAGIVGWIFLRERPSKIWYISTAIAISGLVIASLGELQTNDATGLIFAVIAGSGIGAYINAAKIEVRAGGHSSQLPGMAFLLGSIGLFFVVRSDLLQMEWTTQTILLAVYLGAVTMGIANGIQMLGLRGISPGVASTMMLADPVTAAVLGVVVLGEAVTLNGTVGLILVVIGLAMQSFSASDESVHTK